MDRTGHFPSTVQLLDELVSLPAAGSRRLGPSAGHEVTPFMHGGYTFGFSDRASNDLEAEYYVIAADETQLGPWFLSDHPNLVFDLINIPREADGFTVEHDAMASFLESYGPLTRSFAPSAADLVTSRQANAFNDPRNVSWTYQFSRVVDDLTFVIETTHTRGSQEALAACLVTLDLSPSDSLYRALVLQLLALLLQPPMPRPCVGCGKWFRVTEDASQATHRRGWKRHDSQYHSAHCRKRTRERERRARLRQKKRESTDESPGVVNASA